MPGMDCPTEERLVRMALEGSAVAELRVDLGARTLSVLHSGEVDAITNALVPLGFGAKLLSTREVDASSEGAEGRTAAGDEGGAAEIDTARDRTVGAEAAERRALWGVLAINAFMFVVEFVVGLLAESTGLLADSLDMLADALVYLVALGAVGKAVGAQHRAARLAGALQLLLGLGVLEEVARRALVGSEPVSLAMMLTAAVALGANLLSVRLLLAHRESGAHMQASWIFTTTDALANLGVIAAGVLVGLLGSAIPDLVIGAAIAGIVLRSAWRILRLRRTPGN